MTSSSWRLRSWKGTSWPWPSCPWPGAAGSWRTWRGRSRRCRECGSPCPRWRAWRSSRRGGRARTTSSWPGKRKEGRDEKGPLGSSKCRGVRVENDWKNKMQNYETFYPMTRCHGGFWNSQLTLWLAFGISLHSCRGDGEHGNWSLLTKNQ